MLLFLSLTFFQKAIKTEKNPKTKAGKIFISYISAAMSTKILN